MKTFLPLVTALVMGLELTSHAETVLTALRALSLADTRNLIEVEARHAGASPEHWDFTIYDPATPSHRRKLEVERGAVIASEATPAGGDAAPWDASAIRVDSDRAAALALSYAKTNGVSYASLDYELRRQGANAVPVWILTCLDAKAQPVGSVVITASGGDVVASEGFAKGPAGPAKAEPPVVGGLSQVIKSDQDFLDSQTGRTPVAPLAAAPIADEPAAPISDRDERPAPKVLTKVKPVDPPRVAVRRREGPTGGFVDDGVIVDSGRNVNRPPYETRERVEVRDPDDDWVPFYDEGTHKKIHIGRFFHRLFHGD